MGYVTWDPPEVLTEVVMEEDPPRSGHTEVVTEEDSPRNGHTEVVTEEDPPEVVTQKWS